MKNREHLPPNLEDVLQTLDVLKLVAMKGRGEVREFARYMTIWGAYATLNTFLTAVLGWNVWWPLLYVAFLTTTGPVVGWPLSLVTWALAGLIPLLVWTWTGMGWLTILCIIATAVLAYLFLYGIAVKKGRIQPRPLKVMIAPKIGWAWGILMGGMGLIFSIFVRRLPSDLPWDFLSMVLWGYALGIGLFISGILAPGFFWLGILGIFGIPLATAIHTTLGVWAYLVIAALMTAYSFSLYRTHASPPRGRANR